MNARARAVNRRITAALVGSAAILGGLMTASIATSAPGADTPHIVFIDPAASLPAKVRAEQRRGNEVDAVINSIGEGFVANLDAADVARLRRDPSVLMIERSRPVHASGGVTAAQAKVPADGAPPVGKFSTPVNDPFAMAEGVTGATGSVTGTTVGATHETGEPSHGVGSGASVWYRWTAPESGTLRVNTRGSSFDTLLGAYTGTSVDGLTHLATNDDATDSDLWSSISIGVTAGTTYSIAVDGYGGLTGTTVLAWSLSIPTLPTAPTSARGTAGDARITARWNTPASDGHSAITNYTATASPGGATCRTQGALACVISGLSNGTPYTVSVTATNSVGPGPASADSAPITPVAAAKPPPTSGPGAPISRTAATWGLDRIDQTARELDGHISTPLDGAGVTAYIIDTGVRSDHTEMSGRVLSGFSAIDDDRGTDDCNGHGTHVAGTAAGTNYGVAPAAAIVPIRVLDCTGSGSTAGVIAGIDWAVNNHQAGAPAVANMSLGGESSPVLNAAVAAGVADGITFAVAAGNESADACSVSPAAEPSALTVGASTSGDTRASFSNYGTCLDIFAPGLGITSAYNTSPTATDTLSGTSMASPHVAGAAALLLSGTPSATPAQVATALIDAATPSVLTDVRPGSPNLLLNVSSTMTGAAAGTPPPTPSAPTSGVAPVASAPSAVSVPTAPQARPTTGLAPARAKARAPRAPTLVGVTRVGSRARLNIRAKGATGYQVFANGKLIARMSPGRTTIRSRAIKPGVTIRIRSFTLKGGVSALSNPIVLT